LYRRIDRTRWPEILFETGWSAGTNLSVLRELAQYWRQKYDWFAVQDELNKLPHFRTSINGDGLHFMHFHGSDPGRRFPILLLHGWPGSFIEFVDGAKRLSERFDLVVPSLPGFVFSDAPKSPGMHGGKIGEQIHLLMRKLGYERYGLQGGDWGAIIAIEMARRNPQSMAGLHLNFCTEAPPPPEGVRCENSGEEGSPKNGRVDAFEEEHTLEFDFTYNGLGTGTLAFNNMSGIGQGHRRAEGRRPGGRASDPRAHGTGDLAMG
jgi:pimeloyl-ACP methyl ester carboxylesterase